MPARFARLVAALLLLVLVGGQAFAVSPKAAADPSLTQAEMNYLAMLRQGPTGYGGITPVPGMSVYDLAQSGHQIAAELRRGVYASSIATAIYERSPSMWLMQARWMVYSAVVVFAPEFMPLMRTGAWFPNGRG